MEKKPSATEIMIVDDERSLIALLMVVVTSTTIGKDLKFSRSSMFAVPFGTTATAVCSD